MVSFIIPVYNQWTLTKQCLESLAATRENELFEVIVVDNASSDETPFECPKLVEALFAENALYERQEKNRNFAGAINRGVALAKGDFIFWLNNDTICCPHFLPPLIRSLQEESKIGAVGPLLLYPPKNGRSFVQHAGIVFSLDRSVSHLYEWFPKEHPLLSKRRRFQAITGAAFCMPKERFESLGGLDERFVNGFEDIEFCDRLCKAGYFQTVIPQSRIIHISKQSEGRFLFDTQNSILCGSLCSCSSDKIGFWREDGYEIVVSKWISSERIVLQPVAKRSCHSLSVSQLQNEALAEPYWLEGQLMLGHYLEDRGMLKDAFDCYQYSCNFCTTPDILIPFSLFLSRHDPQMLPSLESAFASFIIDPKRRLEVLYMYQRSLLKIGEVVLAKQVANLSKTNALFFEKDYKKFLECYNAIRELSKK